MKNSVENTLIFIHPYDKIIAKTEIDFILKIDRKIIPIEVKFRQNPKIPIAIKYFMEKYKNTSKIIIFTKEILKKEKNVFYIPINLLPFIEFTE
jgi:predicted AAA+ superfamily ATPase